MGVVKQTPCSTQNDNYEVGRHGHMYPIIREHTFFLRMHETFANIDPLLNHKARFNKFQVAGIIQSSPTLVKLR